MNIGKIQLAASMLLVCFALSNLADGQVIITEDTDEGIDCFKVVTDSASYYFDRVGACGGNSTLSLGALFLAMIVLACKIHRRQTRRRRKL